MWKKDITNWDTLSEETYNLVLSESKKVLIDSNDESTSITNKAYILINIIIGLGGVVVVYITSFFSITPPSYNIIIPAMLLLAAFGIVLYKCFTLIKSRDKYPVGVEPKDIFTSEYLEIPDDSQEEKLMKIIL